MNLYKSLIFILYLGIFLGSGFRTPAQSRDSITLYGTLDTVQVIRQRIQHANEANAGARVTHISPAILQANKTRSLAELLTDHTSIYIKSLGTGALSTASFRGTSASQTRVNWNGINITPPLSGTFDFSQIPVFFTDNINLYYGSSHVKNGTGAIGGSVNLFTDTDWNRGVNGRVLAEYGSYNTYTVGGQVNISGNKSASKTRLYYQHSDNDYTYLNKVLTNQVLSATGHRVLPIESAELEQLVSTGLTIATALVSWWKNNSFTPEAIEADDFLCQLKEHK